MFKTNRSVRRGLRMLGYPVDPKVTEPDAKTVEKFQQDYNRCDMHFESWGDIAITGKIDVPTLNALEHAIRWSKKREDDTGQPSGRSWRALCSGPGRTYAAADESAPAHLASESNYVEILPDGSGKLRNVHTDDALRCNILAFERQGDIVFAVVEVPAQGDLPSGRAGPITCPCVMAAAAGRVYGVPGIPAGMPGWAGNAGIAQSPHPTRR